MLVADDEHDIEGVPGFSQDVSLAETGLGDPLRLDEGLRVLLFHLHDGVPPDAFLRIGGQGPGLGAGHVDR